MALYKTAAVEFKQKNKQQIIIYHGRRTMKHHNKRKITQTLALLGSALIFSVSYAKNTGSVEVSNKANLLTSTLLAVKPMDINAQSKACTPSICPIDNVYADYTLLQVNQSIRFEGAQCLCVTYSPVFTWTPVQTFSLQPGQKLALATSLLNGSQVSFHYEVS
jgi:hypothetical protein